MPGHPLLTKLNRFARLNPNLFGLLSLFSGFHPICLGGCLISKRLSGSCLSGNCLFSSFDFMGFILTVGSLGLGGNFF